MRERLVEQTRQAIRDAAIECDELFASITGDELNIDRLAA